MPGCASAVVAIQRCEISDRLTGSAGVLHDGPKESVTLEDSYIVKDLACPGALEIG